MRKIALLIKALSFLEHEKKIITDGKGHYQLVQENTEVEGTFRANDKGFGFVKLDDENADNIFIASDYTDYAVNGDRVKVRITADGNPWNDKGPEGQVEEIVERGFETLVGEFHPMTDKQVKVSHFIGYVLSNDKKLHNYRVYVSDKGLIPQMRDMVKVSIKNYPDKNNPESMTGVVIKTIGNKNDRSN